MRPAGDRHPLAAVAGARRAAEIAIGLLLPRRCISCRGQVESDGALCPDCWSLLRFLGPPHCAACGYPFEYDPGEGTLCGACLARPPAFDRARAVFAYDDESRAPLLAFKHADRTEAAPSFARLMTTAAGDLLRDAGMVVPVPLHRRRLMARRYNQSALLATALARHAGLPSVPDLLVRTRHTPSQGGLSATGRRRNVRGAFAVRPGLAAMVRDARVLLVDDVFTTGATVEACAAVLKRAGAGAVDVVTLARVVRPSVV